MSNTELEVRPRPLSAGLWTLFSWLRRDDRSVSSESLSSAGSDRTAASFAFLAPAHYQTAASSTFVLPPPGPPTDSYKRRVHDRNIRRQHDRDLTLHRKYGLFKTDGSYDAFSLPPVRRANGDISNKWDRERRATSECLQRRAVHVPGKRRAPAPPAPACPAGSLPRRRASKRAAPQPPTQLTNKENYRLDINTILTQMNSDSVPDKHKSKHNDVTMGCKPEKYSKKESSVKDVKVRPGRSFLKQIFDNKKRNSAIESSTIKILPSISELDKQAAEIIETCKLRASELNNNVRSFPMAGAHSSGSTETGTWFCVNCLRKYNPSVVTCLYCLPAQKTRLPETNELGNVKAKGSTFTQTEKELQSVASSSKNCTTDEKQKLKKMLKEMKDSLPKKPKHNLSGRAHSKNIAKLDDSDLKKYTSSEMPTLRVGSTLQNEIKPQPASNSPSAMKKTTNEAVLLTHRFTPVATQSAVVTQHVVVAHNPDVKNVFLKMNKKDKEKLPAPDIRPGNKNPNIISQKEEIKPGNDNILMHTPLKISSLLNPVYIPKDKVSDDPPKELLNPSAIPKIPVATSNDALKLKKSASTNVASSTSGSTFNSVLEAKETGLGRSQIPIKNEITNDVKHDIDEKNTSTENIPIKPVTQPVKLRIINDVIPETKSKGNIQNHLLTSPTSSSLKECTPSVVDAQNQHIKRRTLINQLEQSIAKGDEQAAAEAAAKLAQLRLSCSVLSFSSQILSNASTSTNNVAPENTPIKATVKNPSKSNQTDRMPHVTSATSLGASVTPSVKSAQIKTTSTVTEKKNAVSQLPISSQVVKDIPQNKNDSPKKQETVLSQPSTSNPSNQNNMISIAVLVEDREATRGPVKLRIRRHANLRDLRQEAQTSLGLATNLQRWIIGRTLCTEDSTLVASLAGADFSAPFYLCIVESESKLNMASSSKEIHAAGANSEQPKTTPQIQVGNVYTELVQLEQQALVPNAENFECGVCMEEYAPGNGVVLRDCVHIFCKDCLSDVVRHCGEPDVPCPATACRGMLQEREIRALVSPEDYERWLARGLAAAESGTRNAFHCRTRDCTGWALCEPGVLRFPCPVCKATNCVPCQAIHEGETCEQYRAKLNGALTDPNQTDDGTRSLLNSLIRRGEALECPECKAIITKKWGCDWVKCSACKTEICWVTRGRRWGPAGRGDTSAGCRCGVDGKKCHPSCGYCH